MDFSIYSPVEEIKHPLFEKKRIQLFVKRDDMIHPFISGNKWRKLKYLLRAANEQDKTDLVTFGGAWSNHLLATSCAAAKFGFKSTGFVRGEDVSNPMLEFCQLFGMELRFTDRESYRDKPALFHSNYSDDSTAFFIDEGGASPEAVQGCAELVDELEEEYNHLFCASGTGTTAAGILNGLKAKQCNTSFHSVPVLKGGSFMEAEINKYLTEPAEFNLHLDYHFGGYAKTTVPLMEFMKAFSSTTGILLDPIYTGKLFYAIFDLAEKDAFKPGEKVLAIHTGGLMGLLGKI